MFSAYLLYILPLVIGAGFLGVGFVFFRFEGYGVPLLRIPGTLAMLVGLALILWIFISAPTPWQRTATFAHIFHTPPEQIIKVRIRVYSLRPLVTKDLTITDRDSLRQIALALGNASETASESPERRGLALTAWRAPIELTTSDGTFYFRAGVTKGVGGFVVVGSEPGGYGWRLGDFRADEFARVLEQLRDGASKR